MSILAKIRRALRIGSRINDSTQNRVLFTGSGGVLADSSDLTYDGTTLSLPSGSVGPVPNLEFSAGTGFYEPSAGTLTFLSAYTSRYDFNNDAILGINNGFYLKAAGVTNMIPGLCPRKDDTDTGIGGGGDDTLSFVVGGVESMRTTESGSAVTQIMRGTVTIGDTGSNNLEVNSIGDLNFTGGSGLQFGEISYHGTGFDTVLAQQDTWYQVLSFDTNVLSNGSVTPDHTNDHITAGKAGKYDIHFGISARSAAANTYHFMIKANNGTADKTNIMVHIVTSVAGQIEARSNSGFASLTANDTVELWVKRTDGGAVSKTITLEHANMHITQKGG